MAVTASKILELARAEIGVKESPPNSNKVKYNDAYGHGDIAWCCVFLWWLFQQAGAPELFFNGRKTAYCPALLTYHRSIGQAVSGEYQPGDIVFFDFDENGVANHVGLCESWDGTYITTIDGNTSATNPANGGMVGRMRRHKKYILGVVRPGYNREEEEDMDVDKLTDEQVLQLVNRMNTVLAKQEPSDWSEEAREWAEESGIIAGDEKGNKQYKKPCTREELVQILYNQKKKDT